MLDEPSLGLAPVVTDATFQKIRDSCHGYGDPACRAECQSRLNAGTRAYVLESGKAIMQGTSAELANNKRVQTAHLGL